MAGGELANFESAGFVGKVIAQIGFERGYVQFFAGANACWLIEKIAHRKISLAICEHGGIGDVFVDIETAQRESVGAVQKFAPG